jgi:hypothetical protein
MELTVRNVNQAFSEIFWKLRVLDLEPEMTRNGPAIVHPELVVTTYLKPQERVLFHAGRDCNPIFHLMESIWMLAGRKDVDFLIQFNRRMSDFSDNGETYNAAYGHRWRNHFGIDQLETVIRMLRHDHKTRQAVIQMWDSADLNKNTKDKACNTQIVFDIRKGALNMTVFNRSNDIWWGAYGANAVHFSILQEFIAASVGVPMGIYRQVSNNLHLYTELYNAEEYLQSPPVSYEYDHYSVGMLTTPIMNNDDYRLFLQECERFCKAPYDTSVYYVNPFFKHVAHPMAMVSKERRAKTGDGRNHAINIAAPDWRKAVLDWIDRREEKILQKAGKI